jgi:type IV pilus assembly protein PilN
MIRINLLPYREMFQRRKTIGEMLSAGVILVFLLVVIFVIDHLLSSRIGALENQIAETQQAIFQLNKRTADIYQFEKNQEEFQRKLDKILDLNLGRKLPVHILEEVSKATPEKLWLTQFSRDQNAIVLNGIALDQETIVTFLNNLENSRYFVDIRLIQTQQFSHQNLKLQRFHISGKIRTPKIEEKPLTGAGGQRIG